MGMYAPMQASPVPLPSAYAATPGAAPFPRPALPTTQAGKEKRHHWIWLGNLITIGIGGYVIYAHWQGTLGLGVAVALFALAALSLGISRFGARWNRASCLEKLLILPGVLAGLVVLVAILLNGSDSDSGHSSGSSHSKSGDSHSSDGDSGDSDLFDGSDSSSRAQRARNRPFMPCPYCGQTVLPGMPVCPRCRQPLR